MITFLTTIHILACLGLITLVLMQDSKGGGMFSGQSSTNSVLGATGGASLANTMTKIVSVILAVTCLGLAVIMAKSKTSVVDTGAMTATQPSVPAATVATPEAATPANTAAPTEPKK